MATISRVLCFEDDSLCSGQAGLKGILCDFNTTNLTYHKLSVILIRREKISLIRREKISFVELR